MKEEVKQPRRKGSTTKKRGTAKSTRKTKAANISFSESFEKIMQRLIQSMEKPGSGVEKDDLDQFVQKVQGMWNYRPTVCIFGQAGAGKSSLCNVLFGENKFEISAVEACTQGRQEDEVSFGGNRLRIIDMPGVGESHNTDDKYQALYLEALRDADLIIWALKADSRAFASDLKVWSSIREKVEELSLPSFFVLTQADKIDPAMNWNRAKNLPDNEQMANLLRKRDVICKDFKVEKFAVLMVSAHTGYGLEYLILSFMGALPNEKKSALLRYTNPEYQSEDSKRKAEEGFWSATWDWCQESAKSVGNFLWEHRKEVVEVAAFIAGLLAKQRGPSRRK